MSHPQLLLPESPTRIDVAQDGPPPILKTETRDLAELAAEFAPFTTGLLHTHGGLATDPVGEFVLGHDDRSCDVAVRDFDFRLFDGVGRDVSEEHWDRRLYFVERRFWPDLLAFLSGIVLVDHARGSYAEVRSHAVPLPRGNAASVAFATAFGLSGNLVNLRLGLRRDRPGGLPGLLRLKPEPAMVELAARAFCRGPEAIQGTRP